jgi:methionyl aminopeptidase
VGRGPTSRTPEQIALMRRAGRIVAEMHDVVRQAARPGVSTRHLDALASRVLEQRGATSNFLGYQGFPAVICASPNEVVVHGIPDDHPLEDGDLLSIDCGAIVDGWHGDAAFTVAVGDIRPADAELLAVAERALEVAIAALVPGGRVGDVGRAVEPLVEAAGFGVVREYAGHGIGRAMHEQPDVPNTAGARGARLEAGHTLAVEPMVTAGSPDVVELDDGWTVRTLDGGRAVHVEHTVVVTDDGPEILTRL